MSPWRKRKKWTTISVSQKKKLFLHAHLQMLKKHWKIDTALRTTTRNSYFSVIICIMLSTNALCFLTFVIGRRFSGSNIICAHTLSRFFVRHFQQSKIYANDHFSFVFLLYYFQWVSWFLVWAMRTPHSQNII